MPLQTALQPLNRPIFLVLSDLSTTQLLKNLKKEKLKHTLLELSLFLFCWLELTTKALERSCRIVGATPSSSRKLTLNKKGSISSVCKQNLCQLPKNIDYHFNLVWNKNKSYLFGIKQFLSKLSSARPVQPNCHTVSLKRVANPGWLGIHP